MKKDDPEHPEAQVPPEFWDLCDRFIDLANELAQEWPPQRVSATILYAAARYNAFVAADQDPDADAKREDICQYFTSQYAKMLADNLKDLLQSRREAPAQPSGRGT